MDMITKLLNKPGSSPSLFNRSNNEDQTPTLFRILLVGQDWVMKNKVGNTLLGKEVFETKEKFSQAKNYNTGFTGYVLNTYITVVSTAELFNPDLSEDVLKQRVKGCMSLCAPGPHALVLVVDPNDFGEEQNQRMVQIMNFFSEQVFNHSIVFFFKEMKQENVETEKIISSCGGRKHQYKNRNQLEALEAIGEVVVKNDWRFVTCDMYDDAKEITEADISESIRPVERKSVSFSSTGSFVFRHKLNLVLCGSNAALKSSAAKLILGLEEQTESSALLSSACVKRDALVYGHHITLVILPSLGNTQLSEDEALRETLQCLTLCGSRVHAFLMVIQGPLSEEDKDEFKNLLHFFGEEAESHCQVVFMGEDEHFPEDMTDIMKGTQDIICIPEGSYHTLTHGLDAPQLLEQVDKMREENGNACYTLDMYVTAQIRTRLRCQNELKMKMKVETLEVQNKDLQQSDQDPISSASDLNLVLCGSDATVKSSAAELILGLEEQTESSALLSSACVKRDALVYGHHITLVILPSLGNTQLSEDEALRETLQCLTLCGSRVHAFLMVIQGPLSEEDKEEFRNILHFFGEEAKSQFQIVFMGEAVHFSQYITYIMKETQDIISLPERSYHNLIHGPEAAQLLEQVDKMREENGNACYTLDMYVTAQIRTRLRCQNELEKVKMNVETLEVQNKDVQESIQDSQPTPHLNLVMCGSNTALKSSAADLILGLEEQTESSPLLSSACVKRDALVYGHHITLVILPSLGNTQLSEDEALRETLQCLTLCDSRVHAFLMVIQGPLSEEDKDEFGKILHFFGEEAETHCQIVFMGEAVHFSQNMTYIMKETQDIISIPESSYHNLAHGSEAARLLEQVDKIGEDNGNVCYTLDMYVTAQIRNQLKYLDDLKEMRMNVETLEMQTKDLQQSNQGDILSVPDLNLVLCGTDAAMKSYVADLILGMDEQTELSPQPSSACLKREAEVCGRHITLILLPSLFHTQLTEGEIIQEIQHILHHNDPGVHAFLLVIPQGVPTDEENEELRRIQHFFGEEVDGYCQQVFTEEFALCAERVDESPFVQSVDESSQNEYHLLDHNSKVLPLLEKVERMIDKNAGCYTLNTFISAQLNSLLKCHQQLEELKMTIQKFQFEDSKVKGSDQGNTDDLRIVILGKTGNGKSATGNTILGSERFSAMASTTSVTTECRRATAVINGRPITVVDTPGFFDTADNNEATKREIIRCIAMAAPGPHAFLLVLTSTGRFTEEEKQTVQMIQQMFGEESEKYMVVLFTRGDDLRKQSFDDYLQGADPNLKSFLRQCGQRYHLFNNRDESNKDQVFKLLDKIDAMLIANGGQYYTTKMFQKAEEALKQNQERIIQEREKQIRKEKEELQMKHEAEMINLKREMEEERNRQEEERRKREEEFKCMEEDMKGAMRTLEEEERCKRSKMEEDFRLQKKQNEEWIKKWTDEVQLERQRQQEEWERKTQAEQKRKEEEEKQRKIKEMEYEQFWREIQKKQTDIFNIEREKIVKKAEEEKRQRLQEYEDRVNKQEKNRKDLEEKIKHAEESRVKDLEEQKRKYEEECQKKDEEENKRRQEEENKWKQQIQLVEKEWSVKQEQHRQERERYEREQEEEKKNREAEEKLKRLSDENERKKIEQDAESKIKEKELEMKKLQQDFELQLMEEEKKSREREAEQKANVEEKLQIQREQFEKQKEKEARDSEEREKRNIEYLKDVHEKEKDILKKETEMEARKQAENEFNETLDRKVREAETKGHDEGYRQGHDEGYDKGKEEGEKEGYEKGKEEGKKEGHVKGKEEGFKKGHAVGYTEGLEKGKEEVEAEQTALGKWIDGAINSFYNKDL